jgi:ABC-type antimicrobial peptide transport system permease subunit
MTLGLPSVIASLLGILSVIALLLAGSGIYGIMAYTTSQRTHEIGIRVALGAHLGHILIMVMKRGIKLTLSGLVSYK